MSSEREQPTATTIAGPKPISDWSEPEDECRNCGARLNSETARLVGDNDGCVPYCAKCRGEVLDEHQLARDEYQTTIKLVRYVRDELRGGRR